MNKFEYDLDAMAEQAVLAAENGLLIVRCHGVLPDGSCTCHEGPNCKSRGKHPAGGKKWAERATDDPDEIRSWFIPGGDPRNIGFLLGDRCGVIDVEADDEQAAEVAEKLGLFEIETPGYTSSRGRHTLFKYRSDLPAKSVKKLDGLEFRLGNQGAACSMLPPSVHATGAKYTWLPGRTPWEMPIAPLPESVVERLADSVENRRTRTSSSHSTTGARAGGKVAQGSRHEYLRDVAWREAKRYADINDGVFDEILENVQGRNLLKCEPPLEDSEVTALVESACNKLRREGEDPWERIGLGRVDGADAEEWDPNGWQLTLIEADPIYYRLNITPADGSPFSVRLAADELQSSRKVARRILQANGEFDVLLPIASRWEKHWGGYQQQNGNRAVVQGLRQKLLDRRTVVKGDVEECEYADLAGKLYEYLASKQRPKKAALGKPSDDGDARWLECEGVSEMWFSWTTVWEKISNKSGQPLPPRTKTHDLATRLKERTGESEFRMKFYRHPVTGRRQRLCRWTARHLEVLAELAGYTGGMA